jgi:hypothetical protein
MTRTRFSLGLAALLAIAGCATSQRYEVVTFPPGNGELGVVGLIVNEGFIYRDVYYASATHLKVQSELVKAGHFSRVVLNNPYLPLQIRVDIRTRPKGSASESFAKALAGAATGFLVPLTQEEIYSGHFILDCRGVVLVEQTYDQPVEKTQFLFLDPSSYETRVIESFVSKFVHDALSSEAFKNGCA